MLKKFAVSLFVLALILASGFAASAAPQKKILFFTKSSGFEHPVISWKDSQASYAQKGLDRYVNHGEKADAYVRFLGGEFIKHGAQQAARNKVTDSKFPGFEDVSREFAFQEEWHSLKDFTPDIHVLTVIDAPAMKGVEYQRPPYPTTWARKEGKGRVWFTAMGHREDVWTNPIFHNILVGGIKWALSEANAEIPPNLKEAAPDAFTNPLYPAPKPATASPKAN